MGEFNHLHDDLENDPQKFFDYYRMRQETFRYILIGIEAAIAKTYLTTGSSFKTLGYSFRIFDVTVGRIVQGTCKAIWEKFANTHTPFPSTDEQLDSIVERFWGKWKFPNCVGCIDGKHVRIRNPEHSGSMYRNYKQYFSIVLQGVAGPYYKFIAIDVGACVKECDGTTENTQEHTHITRRIHFGQADRRLHAANNFVARRIARNFRRIPPFTTHSRNRIRQDDRSTSCSVSTCEQGFLHVCVGLVLTAKVSSSGAFAGWRHGVRTWHGLRSHCRPPVVPGSTTELALTLRRCAASGLSVFAGRATDLEPEGATFSTRILNSAECASLDKDVATTTQLSTICGDRPEQDPRHAHLSFCSIPNVLHRIEVSVSFADVGRWHVCQGIYFVRRKQSPYKGFTIGLNCALLTQGICRLVCLATQSYPAIDVYQRLPQLIRHVGTVPGGDAAKSMNSQHTLGTLAQGNPSACTTSEMKYPIRLAEKRGRDKGDIAMRINCAIATKLNALNSSAVLSSHCVYQWDFKRRPFYFIVGKPISKFNTGARPPGTCRSVERAERTGEEPRIFRSLSVRVRDGRAVVQSQVLGQFPVRCGLLILLLVRATPHRGSSFTELPPKHGSCLQDGNPQRSINSRSKGATIRVKLTRTSSATSPLRARCSVLVAPRVSVGLLKAANPYLNWWNNCSKRGLESRRGLKRGEHGEAQKLKGGGNGRSPRKPAGLRRRTARFPLAKNPGVTRPGIKPDGVRFGVVVTQVCASPQRTGFDLRWSRRRVPHAGNTKRTLPLCYSRCSSYHSFVAPFSTKVCLVDSRVKLEMELLAGKKRCSQSDGHGPYLQTILEVTYRPFLRYTEDRNQRVLLDWESHPQRGADRWRFLEHRPPAMPPCPTISSGYYSVEARSEVANQAVAHTGDSSIIQILHDTLSGVSHASLKGEEVDSVVFGIGISVCWKGGEGVAFQLIFRQLPLHFFPPSRNPSPLDPSHLDNNPSLHSPAVQPAIPRRGTLSVLNYGVKKTPTNTCTLKWPINSLRVTFPGRHRPLVSSSRPSGNAGIPVMQYRLNQRVLPHCPFPPNPPARHPTFHLPLCERGKKLGGSKYEDHAVGVLRSEFSTRDERYRILCLRVTPHLVFSPRWEVGVHVLEMPGKGHAQVSECGNPLVTPENLDQAPCVPSLQQGDPLARRRSAWHRIVLSDILAAEERGALPIDLSRSSAWQEAGFSGCWSLRRGFQCKQVLEMCDSQGAIVLPYLELYLTADPFEIVIMLTVCETQRAEEDPEGNLIAVMYRRIVQGDTHSKIEAVKTSPISENLTADMMKLPSLNHVHVRHWLDQTVDVRFNISTGPCMWPSSESYRHDVEGLRGEPLNQFWALFLES
ncbi:hypothetical protein PR048_022257 [Dryococelus australis]|uniref:DDE Tnp4 domain-containing protein n=1 Tax=Dryococelus australis TaxID=614101 RepID=A0ABQ9H0H2_9NEOP|nr:hypothetical protein PR048_022257 [Dryococelus australis]